MTAITYWPARTGVANDGRLREQTVALDVVVVVVEFSETTRRREDDHEDIKLMVCSLGATQHMEWQQIVTSVLPATH